MTVARLVTLVDVGDDGNDVRTMSVSARHEAVLADGRRCLLLDGRGWTSTLVRARRDDVPGDTTIPGIWTATSVEEIAATARSVVGPDEPLDGGSQEDAEAAHWSFLAEVLRLHGVVVDARELQRLPHDVMLSERLLARTRAETA